MILQEKFPQNTYCPVLIPYGLTLKTEQSPATSISHVLKDIKKSVIKDEKHKKGTSQIEALSQSTYKVRALIKEGANDEKE